MQRKRNFFQKRRKNPFSFDDCCFLTEFTFSGFLAESLRDKEKAHLLMRLSSSLTDPFPSDQEDDGQDDQDDRDDEINRP